MTGTKAVLPPPWVADCTQPDGTPGVVRWAGQQRMGDGTTDVLLVVDYDPEPFDQWEPIGAGRDRLIASPRRMPVFPGTLGVPEQARRDIGLWWRPSVGILPNTDWVLRVARDDYDRHVRDRSALAATRAFTEGVPYVDVVDRHSNGTWRLGNWSQALDHPHGFIHVWEAEPQPCTYRTDTLTDDRYAAALAMTEWDKYL